MTILIHNHVYTCGKNIYCNFYLYQLLKFHLSHDFNIFYEDIYFSMVSNHLRFGLWFVTFYMWSYMKYNFLTVQRDH